MNHSNGSLARKLKACFVDGPWHCRSDFRIVYRKASLNTNADALSQKKGPELTATTRIDARLSTVQIQEAHRSGEVLSQLYRALKTSQRRPKGGNWR